MRKVFCALALAALMVLLADIAQAQRGGGGFRTTGVALLVNKSVQEELKVSDEQKTKIGEIAQELNKKREEIVGKRPDFKDKEAKEAFTKYFEALNDPKNKEKLSEIEATQTKAAMAILKTDQAKRFKQIETQQLRIRAFTNEEVMKELGLSAEQKEKAKAIVDEISQDIGDLTKGGKGFGFNKEAQQKIAALNKEGMDKITAILTDDQKTKWKDMVGEPFEVRFEGFGGFKGKGKDKE